MDPLFPELPEDLTALSDEDLAQLLKEHEAAAELIDKNDEDFVKGLSADEVIAAYEAGVEQIETIVGEQKARVEQEEAFLNRKAELAERRKAKDEPEADEETPEEPEAETEEPETLAAEAEELADESPVTEDDEADSKEEETVEEPVEVVASADEQKKEQKPKRQTPMRRPAAPSPDRMPSGETGAVLVAAAGAEGLRPGGVISDRKSLAKVMKGTADRWGRVSKHEGGVEQRILVASATFPFPEERQLHSSDWAHNSEKIAAFIPAGVPGVYGNQALTASGGLCAPLEPIYSMPNFASTARPVRDALPSFQADRGGVNVPAATYIGDITTAISTIEESDDALGGTFATKSCQDLDCPTYTEVPVTVLSHCREYGNLNSMAWPEKIAHENDLTMAAHARTAESYLLDRIKALSINVTQAEILSAYADFIHAVTKAQAAIRFRLRMERSARFRVLAPQYLPDLLAADTAMTQFDRFQAQNEMAAHLERYGISVTYYLDDIGSGTSQGFAAETASALDDFPDDVQWAIFPEGEFIHVDSGSLELGIVRDSTLNSTNDYQIFGETFENVALLGPDQGALWVTQGICPNGEFPVGVTGLSC
jgi:hypothetical protein